MVEKVQSGGSQGVTPRRYFLQKSAALSSSLCQDERLKRDPVQKDLSLSLSCIVG